MAAATFNLDVDVRELGLSLVDDARVVIEAMVTPAGEGIVTDPATGRIYVTEQWELPGGAAVIPLPVSAQMSPANYQYGATVLYRREGDRTYRKLPRIVFNSGGDGATLKLGNVAPQATVLPPTHFPGGIPGPQGIPGTPGVGQVNVPDLLRNYVPNPTMADLTGWTVEANTSVELRPGEGRNGRNAFVVTKATDGSAVSVAYYATGLTAGRVYTLAHYVERVAGDQGVALVVGGGQQLGGINTTRDASRGVLLTFTFRATQGTHSVFNYNSDPNNPSQPAVGTGAAFRLSEPILSEGYRPAPYFTGDDAGCRWLGDARNSISVKSLWDADDVLRADQAPVLGYNPAKPLSSLDGPLYGVSRDLLYSDDGEPWVELTVTADASVDNFYSPEGEQGGVHWGMKPGKTYTITAEGWNVDVPTSSQPDNSSAEGVGGMRLQPFTKAVGGGYVAAVSRGLQPGERGLMSVTFTMPDNPEQAWVRLYNGGTPGQRVRYRNMQVSEGGFAQPYVSGWLPGCQWLGAPGYSGSVRLLPTRDQTLITAPELARNIARPSVVSTTGSTRVTTTLRDTGLADAPVARVARLGLGEQGAPGYEICDLAHVRLNAGQRIRYAVGYYRENDAQPLSFNVVRADGSTYYSERARTETSNGWSVTWDTLTATNTGVHRITAQAYGAPFGAIHVLPVVVVLSDQPDQGLGYIVTDRYPDGFVDGDAPGCKWLGPAGNSQSVRTLVSKVDSDMLVWLDAGRARGKGSPEGRVTAPAGARYVDTQATAGAVEWTKHSGVGATGWRVSVGRTGWRDVTSLLAPGWQCTNAQRLLVRRDVDDVELRTGFLTNTGTGNTAFGWQTMATLPAGFSANPGPDPESAWRNTGPADTPVQMSGGLLRVLGALSNNSHSLWGTLTWHTDDQWPAALPGNPT